MQDYTLDVEDILNENLMPATLMLIEEREQSEWRNLSIKKLDDEFECITKERIKDDGSFPTALNSMRYHRKMINEFLCSKFVAEKILKDIQPKKQMLSKRLGEAIASPEIENEKNNSLSLDDGQQKINNKRPRMLFDEGSYQYKNWLAKTTTLNDIYRTMGLSQNFNKPNIIEKNDSSSINNRNDQYIDDEEYEEGDVSGFMMQKPLDTATNGINSFNPNNFNALHAINEKTAGLGNFGNSPLQNPSSISSSLTSPSAHFNNDFEGLSKGYQYGPPPSAPQQQQDYSYGNHHAATFNHMHSGGEMKAINLKDIFEIALTTLAFLSFGMFIVQVIMCISMAKSNDQMMMPIEMTAEGNEAEAVEMEVRMRRSIEDKQFQYKPNPNYDINVKRINEIAKRALRSFEAFVISKHDNGQCLKRFICENNKFSRRTKDLQKFLIPSLGLALSYLSNKINNNPIISNLDNIQASIIGIGRGNCSTKYKCDIKFLNQKRK